MLCRLEYSNPDSREEKIFKEIKKKKKILASIILPGTKQQKCQRCCKFLLQKILFSEIIIIFLLSK